MIIDLITLKTSPWDFDFSVTAEKIDLDSDDARLLSDVQVNGTLTRHIAQTDVEGAIGAGLEIFCTRCLKPLERKFEIPFEVGFVTPENFTDAKEAEINASDLDISVIDGNEIDLTEIVREQILLNLPEQVFCQDDCKGLCPECGANRNLIDCSCLETETDPRWAALKNLK